MPREDPLSIQIAYLHRWFRRAALITRTFVRAHVVGVGLVAGVTLVIVYVLEPPDVAAGEFRFFVYGLVALAALTLVVLVVSLVVTPAILEQERLASHRQVLEAHNQARAAAQEERDVLARRIERGPELRLTIMVSEAERAAVDLRDEARQRWLEREAARYGDAALKELRRRDRAGADRPALFSPFVDMRSAEEYTAEVNAYLAEAERHWTAGLSAIAAERELAPLVLEVTNHGDRVVSNMTLKAMFAPGIGLVGSAQYAGYVSRFPEPPDELGLGGFHIAPQITIPHEPAVAIETTEQGTAVRFPAIDLFPGDRRPLHPIYLLVPQNSAGGDVLLRWVATAQGINEPAAGVATVPISDRVVAPETLLAVDDDGVDAN